MNDMKIRIIKIAALLLAAVSLNSCYDEYIGDYDYPNMGFVRQRQVRTVVSTTNKIYIGVSIGGKREIDLKDWANFSLDETLLEGTGLKMLPETYYVMDDPNTFHVRKPNLAVADVGISFTDAFYADPACLTRTYALPFRLLATSIPAEENPYGAIREGAETTIAAIKYISGYSGTYYKLGTVTETDADGLTEETVYAKGDLSANETVLLTTKGRDVLVRPGLGNSPEGGLIITIDETDGVYSVSVKMQEGGPELLSASGEYLAKGEYKLYSSDEDAPQINLEYTYAKDGSTFTVEEKLVLRQYAERELKVETF